MPVSVLISAELKWSLLYYFEPDAVSCVEYVTAQFSIESVLGSTPSGSVWRGCMSILCDLDDS